VEEIMMSRFAFSKSPFVKFGAAFILIATSFAGSNATAGEGITPDELSQMLAEQFGEDAIITNGVLVGTYPDGATPFNFTIPSANGPAQGKERFAEIGTFSTPIFPGFGECSPPLLDIQYAGPTYVEWCKESATIDGITYEAKSAYYYYNGLGDYIFWGSQYWDCENSVDYGSMPVPVRVGACD
jgi:hypothetical protein